MENEIFKSLFQIVTFFNDPKHDMDLLRKAGIKGDQNLLPIIVRVGIAKTINIGDLAKQVGKNHSSTSRQIDKFEKQGL
jgi:DNA-binding MarR family transcriptional regulator